MQDSKGTEAGRQKTDERELDERKGEATSDETLSDLDETETDSSSDTPDPGPSPDGLIDEPDEIKDAGPM